MFNFNAPRPGERLVDPADGQIYEKRFRSNEWTPVTGPLGIPVRARTEPLTGRPYVRREAPLQQPRPAKDQFNREIQGQSDQPLYQLPLSHWDLLQMGPNIAMYRDRRRHLMGDTD
ncbi:hypothetical protein BN159_6002 [Streptomyces davaonensis JCM 4913]|uniref:Uncharacterized protein n=1 Tax=Streptomyces davaonensis (strain DSM 101723 / JCM 4913 / KCC S-0913 / 768) TaxID=1214101 RepID=K4R2A0_STRDJ|nr:hypothetical protein BN159_6002 [Streptomyces davaonensis JCM 4913]